MWRVMRGWEVGFYCALQEIRNIITVIFFAYVARLTRKYAMDKKNVAIMEEC